MAIRVVCAWCGYRVQFTEIDPLETLQKRMGMHMRGCDKNPLVAEIAQLKEGLARYKLLENAQHRRKDLTPEKKTVLERIFGTNPRADKAERQIEEFRATVAEMAAKSPWPENVWVMTRKQYVETIADKEVRSAISGVLMRLGWECAVCKMQERMDAAEPMKAGKT